MRQPIRVGILGLGRAGWDIHARQLKNRKAFAVTAVADPLPERRAEAARELGCRTFADPRALLAAGGTDLVVVATRSVDHAAHAVAALARGNHVVCEKPMAMSVAEADRMIAASRRARRRLFIHQNYRWFDEYVHLQEIVDSRTLGEVFQVTARWTGYARRNDWQTLRRNGGGVLNNTGPHLLDMALQFLGSRCVDVWADLKHVKDAGDCEDHVKLLLRGANGRVCDLEISTAHAAPATKWTILGSAGALTSDGTTSHLKWYDPRKVRKLSVWNGAALHRAYGVDGKGEKLPWRERTVPAKPRRPAGTFYDNVEAVLLRGGRLVVTPESVRELIRVIAVAKRGTRF